MDWDYSGLSYMTSGWYGNNNRLVDTADGVRNSQEHIVRGTTKNTHQCTGGKHTHVYTFTSIHKGRERERDGAMRTKRRTEFGKKKHVLLERLGDGVRGCRSVRICLGEEEKEKHRRRCYFFISLWCCIDRESVAQ